MLTKLDQTEQNLRILEERKVTRVERARIAKLGSGPGRGEPGKPRSLLSRATSQNST